ncbi:mitochondrial initiation factor 2; Ifm1p [Heterostelium album PN500]|uniref:Translation initiation factor IF-2, chloroplastic n=1 Tax=Heterostelium pallidum (strain ATCC 26659 / Pp 5 / PN500) TaxID=670386 RepID=D3AY97_HETP5|nr:mitochondrial initiation factor 2; Ifm1p [Heterostelium album PN500]EFA85924.1 mitochondrial initiation factor 2; Ifm1p [Heterostelium album PN500]|eukprot:XP_020438030.1 mitochondrial initiation factor 2; Ifm1p [Heterostelium album PN500]
MLSNSINRPLSSVGYKNVSFILSSSTQMNLTIGMIGHKPYSSNNNINNKQSSTSLFSNGGGGSSVDRMSASSSTAVGGATNSSSVGSSGSTTGSAFQIPGSPIPPSGKVNYFVQPNQQQQQPNQQQQAKPMFPPLPPNNRTFPLIPNLPPKNNNNSYNPNVDQPQSRFHPLFHRQNNNNNNMNIQNQPNNNNNNMNKSTSQPILPKIRGQQQQQQYNSNKVEYDLDEDDDYEEYRAATKRKQSQKKSKAMSSVSEKEILLPLVPTPKSMSSLTGRSTVEILKWMIKMGEAPTRSDEVLGEDLLNLFSEDIGVKFARVKERSEFRTGKRQQDATWKRKTPVVTVVGHIDHGKTSLLDYLRNTSVVEKEAGRITQHIGAFEVEIADGQKITFMDTPGHAAFSTMRVRGVSTTDIAILIVAADDGVQEQTIEAIKAIHDAKVPFIVAINKIDKPGADVELVKRQLLEQGVALEGHGGMVPYSEISAKTGEGIQHLEETILLSSEIYDLQASFEGNPEGVVIESTFIKNRGVSATILVKHGILKTGQFFVCGDTYGKIREMKNFTGANIKEAPPSTPVEIFGFKLDPPSPGDEIHVVESEQRAKEIIEARNESKSRSETLDLIENVEATAAAAENSKLSAKKGTFKKYKDEDDNDYLDPEKMAEEVKANLGAKPVKEKIALHKLANLYLKGDVGGSVEALQFALKALPQDEEITYNVVKTAYGEVTDVDLKEVALLKAPLIYFGPKLDHRICENAKKQGVPLIEGDVIYHVVDNLKVYLESTLDPVDVYTVIGEAKVQQLFNIDKTNQIEITAAGCKVTNGILKKGSKVRVKRGEEIIHDGRIEIIKHFKELVKEVNKGQECGICIKNFDEIVQGDTIIAYTKSEETRKLGEKVKIYR